MLTTTQAAKETQMTTHRAIQLSQWIDRGLTERIRYRNAARKAAELGNKNALGFFTARAVKWDNIISKASSLIGNAHH